MVGPRSVHTDSPFLPERRQRSRPSGRAGTPRDHRFLRPHGVRDQQHLQWAERGRHQLHHHALPSRRGGARRHAGEQAARVARHRRHRGNVPSRPQADHRLAVPRPAVHQYRHPLLRGAGGAIQQPPPRCHRNGHAESRRTRRQANRSRRRGQMGSHQDQSTRTPHPAARHFLAGSGATSGPG
jgi:hypothetical protein